MKRLSVQFREPYSVEAVEETLPEQPADRLLVRTMVSAVSPGTELLIYRGQWPAGIPVDDSIPALSGAFRYPLTYGYAAVGRVVAVGSDVPAEWLDRIVFSFNPHQSLFLARPEDVIPVPDSLDPEEAALLPNMETAVTFLMDGRPMIGECVAVIGQGVVGLLTATLLARQSPAMLVTFDRFGLRRERSLAVGAHESLDPSSLEAMDRFHSMVSEHGSSTGADLTYELTGNPDALNQAIAVTGFGGRIVVGSWYGGKHASVDLGGRFHRGRLRMISSQVSTIAPEFTGLWTKARRLRFAMQMLEQVRPAGLITHRFPVKDAAAAYAVLDRHPEEAIQVLFTYEDAE